MIYSQLLTMQQSVIKIYISQVTRARLERKAVLIRLRDRPPKAVFTWHLGALIRPALFQFCHEREHTYCLCLHKKYFASPTLENKFLRGSL